MSAGATTALLKAIEGFSGATAGQGQHESTNALLARVKGEIAKGHGAAPDSPGRREAMGAAQRNFPSESAHSSGDGQVRSVKPDSGPHPGDEAPRPWSEHDGEDKLTGTEGVPTRGHTVSNASSRFPAGLAQLREAAGARLGPKSDGNARSALPSSPPPNSARIGNVSVGKVASDRSVQANRNFAERTESKTGHSSTANPREIGQEPLNPREPGFRGAEAEARKRIAAKRA